MANKIEKKIIFGSWITMIYLLFWWVPKERIREAHVVFLFKQVITWIFGLLIVEKNLIRYPYRPFFKKSSKSSFTFEYFIYPALSVFFNLYYPEKRNLLIKFLHYFFHVSIITIFEAFANKYTKLICYKKWSWYWSFITLWISNYISRIYYKWFFQVESHQKDHKVNFTNENQL